MRSAICQGQKWWARSGFSTSDFSIFHCNGDHATDVNTKNVDHTGRIANSTFSHFVVSFLVAVLRFVTVGDLKSVMCAFRTLILRTALRNAIHFLFDMLLVQKHSP